MSTLSSRRGHNIRQSFPFSVRVWPMFITSHDKFASWFNETYPGAYRLITAEDAGGLTDCGLIGHNQYYSKSRDGETVRGILEYEQMREKRSAKEIINNNQASQKCRICSQPLPTETEGKKGRPREYCPRCESMRNKDRQKRLRFRRRNKVKTLVT